MAGLFLVMSCTGPSSSSHPAAASVAVHATFLHIGFAAGPVVFTGEAGVPLEERRSEPFGAPIGAADMAARDLNALNKRTDATTGWSDHGARWVAPELGRWLSPDPPVQGPDPETMFAPWALHPYQYVNQNPMVFWDPDGREPEPVMFIDDYIDRVRRDEIEAHQQEIDRLLLEVKTGADRLMNPPPPPPPYEMLDNDQRGLFRLFDQIHLWTPMPPLDDEVDKMANLRLISGRLPVPTFQPKTRSTPPPPGPRSAFKPDLRPWIAEPYARDTAEAEAEAEAGTGAGTGASAAVDSPGWTTSDRYPECRGGH